MDYYSFVSFFLSSLSFLPGLSVGEWVAREVYLRFVLDRGDGIMSGGIRWSVESKEFELLVKAGAAGVRIYERSKGKQRSIFLHKDELAWLVRTVEDVVAVKDSEVFWDQFRAGYSRIIAQRCSNRHGCFLTVEEFDGRRCGSILLPEGFSSCLPVSGLLGGGGVQRFGRWCLLVFFGVYGGRRIIGALRTWRGPQRTFYLHVFILCIFGLAFVSPMSISFDDFFVCFSLYSLVILVVYFLCTLMRLTLLVRLVITYKKKIVV